MNHKAQIEEARAAGYNDAFYDGLYLFQLLPCTCHECREAYESGQEKAYLRLAGQGRKDEG